MLAWWTQVKKVIETPKQHTHQYTVHGRNRGKWIFTVNGRTSQKITKWKIQHRSLQKKYTLTNTYIPTHIITLLKNWDCNITNIAVTIANKDYINEEKVYLRQTLQNNGHSLININKALKKEEKRKNTTIVNEDENKKREKGKNNNTTI